MLQSQADSLTIEAGTAESALEEITSRLGPNAEIVEARKVQKGGIGGFFARELVQITARPREGEKSPFEAALDSALGGETAVEANTPEPSFPSPASPPGPAPADWRLSGGVDWSVTALARSDLPGAVIESVMDLDPRDDLGWIAAVAGAVAPWCRRLPSGSGVLVGQGAGRLGTALGIPVAQPPEMAPYQGEFATPITGAQGDLEWLEMVQGGRWVDLVVGEGEAGTLLDDEVLAVSWSGDEGVATALRLASSLGLVLGYGMGSELGAPAFRATPVDVALAVRKLVGRR